MVDYNFLLATAPFQPLLRIDNIYTIYYFELSKDYTYPGEAHDFWEMVFIDSGEVEIGAKDKVHTLKEGDIIFHEPNEFHSIKANGEKAANVVVISFRCHSDKIYLFSDKILQLTLKEREILSNIFSEARKVFSENLGPVFLDEMRLAKSAEIGAEQMMYSYLEQFLIRLLRDKKELPKRATNPYKKALINEIIAYMREHLESTLLISDICKRFHISNTYLKTVFKKETGYPVMQYFRHLKIEEAKMYIRENRGTFTEYAQKLGFDSVHHFSLSFKKVTGLSPSEYSRSIKRFEQEMIASSAKRFNQEEESIDQ